MMTIHHLKLNCQTLFLRLKFWMLFLLNPHWLTSSSLTSIQTAELHKKVYYSWLFALGIIWMIKFNFLITSKTKWILVSFDMIIINIYNIFVCLKNIDWNWEIFKLILLILDAWQTTYEDLLKSYLFLISMSQIGG